MSQGPSDSYKHKSGQPASSFAFYSGQRCALFGCCRSGVTEGCGDDRQSRLLQCSTRGWKIADSTAAAFQILTDARNETCRIAAALIPCLNWSISKYLVERYFDRSVSQDPSAPLRAPRRSSMGYWWQGNGAQISRRKGRCTYRSIRQERYDFDKPRHSGSLLPRWDLMQRRYESMISLHSPGM
jgi:hypothetical protein